jgi:hypothetical protein
VGKRQTRKLGSAFGEDLVVVVKD